MRLVDPLRPHPPQEAGKHRARDVVDVNLPSPQVRGEGVQGRHILAPRLRVLLHDHAVRELEEVQLEDVQVVCTPHLPDHPVHILPHQLRVRVVGHRIPHPRRDGFGPVKKVLVLDLARPREVTGGADDGGGNPPDLPAEVGADVDEVGAVLPPVGQHHDGLDGDHLLRVWTKVDKKWGNPNGIPHQAQPGE